VADFEIKRGDTWPPLEAQLTGESGVIDLTDADSVRVNLRSDTVSIVTGPVDFVDRAAGKLSYQWETGDLAVAGTYRGEFEIHWNTGDIQTVPNDDYFTVEVFQDLDPS